MEGPRSVGFFRPRKKSRRQPAKKKPWTWQFVLYPKTRDHSPYGRRFPTYCYRNPPPLIRPKTKNSRDCSFPLPRMQKKKAATFGFWPKSKRQGKMSPTHSFIQSRPPDLKSLSQFWLDGKKTRDKRVFCFLGGGVGG